MKLNSLSFHYGGGILPPPIPPPNNIILGGNDDEPYALKYVTVMCLWLSGTKNLPATQQRRVQSLGQEDLLEKKTAPHPNILAWEIPWMQKPCGLQSVGVEEELDMT